MSLFEHVDSAVQAGIKKNTFWAKAPANIALIKYMGKACEKLNVADNASLSFTLLDHVVKVELEPATAWRWLPLDGFGDAIILSQQEQDRFIDFAKDVAIELGLERCFLIKSSGNFPASCGVASSAASFAALTSALAIAAQSLLGVELTIDSIIKMSQRGSGSSCRSFFKNWVVWQDKVCRLSDVYYNNCLHQLIVVSDSKKRVGSSEAHNRVTTSLNYQGRSRRVLSRLSGVREALVSGCWQSLFTISWHEFWDMHNLFHTSNPAFCYLLPETLDVLNNVQAYWDKYNDGPVVTLDAGANVHLLYRGDQQEVADYFRNKFNKTYRVI